jgi:pectinesterase
MNIKKPSNEIVDAVNGAMAWFDRAKILGKRLETFTNNQGKSDRRLVADDSAAPIWARFYNLEDMRPYVCDRDGVKKYDIAEIGYERRNGYGWYGDWPAELYPKYEKWKGKLEKQGKKTK